MTPGSVLNNFFNFYVFLLFVIFLQVVFSPNQISMFSYEQAVAVTSLQIAGLSDVQNTALALVLNPDIILGVKCKAHKLLQSLVVLSFSSHKIRLLGGNPTQNSSHTVM